MAPIRAPDSQVARLRTTLALLAGILCVPTVACAQSVEQFYAGRQIKFIVGGGIGGGYDFYSRMVTHFMTRHLPGHPIFVVQTMPGAGGIIAANYLYNIAPRDGSEIGMVGRASGTQPLIDPKDKAPKYIATKFNWIGTPQQEIGLMLVRQPSPIQTIQDLKTHQLVLSGTSPAAPPSYYPRLLNRLFGTKFKVIDGYKSSQEALLALERGEVEGHLSGSSAAPLRARVDPLVKQGTVKVLAQIGLAKDGNDPDAALILDLAKTTTERQIMELVLAQQVMAWPTVAPPELPPDRIKALRDAFDATMQDPEFLAEASKQKFGVNPVSGEQLSALLERIYATPKDILDLVVGHAADN